MNHEGITQQSDGVYADLTIYGSTGVSGNEFWSPIFQDALRKRVPGFFPSVSKVKNAAGNNAARFSLVREGESVNLCAISQPVDSLNVPQEEWDRLQAAFDSFKTSGGQVTLEDQIGKFSLPKRATERELYRAYIDPVDKQVRLLVLWGCEKQTPRTMGSGPASMLGASSGAVAPNRLGATPVSAAVPSASKAGATTAPEHRPTAPAGGGRSLWPILLALLVGGGIAAGLYHYFGARKVTPGEVKKTVLPGQIMKVTMAPADGFIPATITARVSRPGTLSFHGAEQKADADKDYTRTFQEPGKYRISWKPEEPKPGDTKLNDESHEVEVRRKLAAPGPVANLQLSPNPAKIGEPVTAAVHGSYEPSGAPLRHEIQWGEGGPWEEVPREPSPQHTYAREGEYEVKLRVGKGVPSEGGSETSKTLSVYKEGAPSPTPNRKPVPNLAVDAIDHAARQIKVSDQSNDPDGSIVEWALNWGDGSPEETFKKPFTELPHTFAGADEEYTLQLRCTDDKGASDIAKFPISLKKDQKEERREVIPPVLPPVDPGQLRIHHLTESLGEPRNTFREELQIEPPAAAPELLLTGHVCVVTKDGKELHRVKDEPIFALNMEPGEYRLQAEATDGEGKKYTGELPLRVPTGTWPSEVPPPTAVPTVKPSPAGSPSPTAKPSPAKSSPTPPQPATPSKPTPTPPPKPLETIEPGDIGVDRVSISDKPGADEKVEAIYRVRLVTKKSIVLRDVKWELKPEGPGEAMQKSGESATFRLAPGTYHIRATAETDQGPVSVLARESFSYDTKVISNFQKLDK